MSKARPPPKLYSSHSTTNQPCWSSLMGLFVFILRFSPFLAFFFSPFSLAVALFHALSGSGYQFLYFLQREYTSWNTRARWWYFNWFHLIAFVAFTSTSLHVIGKHLPKAACFLSHKIICEIILRLIFYFSPHTFISFFDAYFHGECSVSGAKNLISFCVIEFDRETVPRRKAVTANLFIAFDRISLSGFAFLHFDCWGDWLRVQRIFLGARKRRRVWVDVMKA